MTSRFEPGQVWEMRCNADDPHPYIFLLLEKTPARSFRHVMYDNIWRILVLVADVNMGHHAGVVTDMSLDVAFPGWTPGTEFEGMGFDMYDNEYVRLA